MIRSSETPKMDNLYYTVNIDGGRELCISPLTDRLIELSGQDVEDQSGYFLYERNVRGGVTDIEIIARVLSLEGAFRLREAFKMS
jgi:hypothetical protein